jgi:HD superfamily phosphodiesterase
MNKNEIIALSWKGSHLTNPYHNLKHCVDVYNWCEKILEYENEPMSLELQFATILHDYNHSGGKFDDNYNIPEAIRHVCEGTIKDAIDNAGADAVKIVKLISITKFIDGTFPHDPETLEEMAIRDADLMTTFLPLGESIVAINGLYSELLFKNSNMTRDQFWEGNVKFMNNATFYTKYGNMMKEQLNEKLDILKEHWNG